MRLKLSASIFLFAQCALSFPNNFKFRQDFSKTQVQEKTPRIEQEKIFHKIFKSHLNGPNECPEDAGELDEAFASGYFTPRVVSHFQGSFSKPDSNQDLYIIFVGECGATSADHFGTSRLVVIEDDKVVVNSKYFWDSGEYPEDMDGDGKLEWVATSIYCNQGMCFQEATVVGIIKNNLQPIVDLGRINEQTCNFQDNTGKMRWAIVTISDENYKKNWSESDCRF